jgi:hypothetical protein
MQDEMDLDAPVSPGSVPGLGLGDLLKWAPVIETLISDVEQAIHGGNFSPPPLKFKVAGKHIEIDSQIKVS